MKQKNLKHFIWIGIAAAVLLAALFVPELIFRLSDLHVGRHSAVYADPVVPMARNILSFWDRLNLLRLANESKCHIMDEGVNQEEWQQSLCGLTEDFFRLLNKYVPGMEESSPGDFQAETIRRTTLTAYEDTAVAATFYAVSAFDHTRGLHLAILFDEQGRVYNVQLSPMDESTLNILVALPQADMTRLAEEIAGQLSLNHTNMRVETAGDTVCTYYLEEEYEIGIATDQKNSAFSIYVALQGASS